MGILGFKDSKSRRTSKLHDWFESYNNLPPFFFLKKKYPEAIDLNIALRSQILIWVNVFTTVFFKKFKNSNAGMWGVYPEAIVWNIALRTQILLCVSVSEVSFKKKTFRA